MRKSSQRYRDRQWLTIPSQLINFYCHWRCFHRHRRSEQCIRTRTLESEDLPLAVLSAHLSKPAWQQHEFVTILIESWLIWRLRLVWCLKCNDGFENNLRIISNLRYSNMLCCKWCWFHGFLAGSLNFIGVQSKRVYSYRCMT